MTKQHKQLKITLVKSPIGRQPKHKDTLRGLGLRRMHQSVTREDTACVRGMVNQINYLLQVEEV